MTGARRYAVWPDPRSRLWVLESHSRGVDRQSRMWLIFFWRYHFWDVCLACVSWAYLEQSFKVGYDS